MFSCLIASSRTNNRTLYTRPRLPTCGIFNALYTDHIIATPITHHAMTVAVIDRRVHGVFY